MEKFASFRYNGNKICLGNESKTENEIFAETKPIYYENAVQWTLRLKNISEKNSLQITEVFGLDIEIPCLRETNAEFNGLTGDDCGSESFIKINKEIAIGESIVNEIFSGRSSDKTAFPFFDLTVGNEVYVFGIGWSGSWKCEIKRTEKSVIVTAGQKNCNFYLFPGEEARSAKILLYKNSKPREDCCYEFREIMRKNCSPQNVRMPIASQTFDRYYNNNVNNFRSEEAQLKIESRTAEIKNIDTFWLDAAWFRDAFPHGVGNYSFEPGFPDGLKNLSDRIHKDGKRFMVWFEPERIDTGSETFEKFGHDGKFLLNISSSSTNRMLNLGYKPAFDYIYDTISGFIRDYKIDIFRVDHNFSPDSYWSENDELGRKGITEMRSIEGLYSLWDKLLAEFPGLMIDNCSSGGRRLDLETLSRSVSCWRSDTGCRDDTEDEKRSIFAQNMTIGLSQYIPYHQTVSWEPKAYYIRTGMGYGIACAFDLMNDEFDCEDADFRLQEVKNLSHYRDGKIIEITKQSTADDIWFAYQLQCEDSACGFAFRRDSCSENTYLFIPSEISSENTYDVTVTDENYNKKNFRLSGEEFTKGITLTSENPLDSFVIEWSKCT